MASKVSLFLLSALAVALVSFCQGAATLKDSGLGGHDNEILDSYKDLGEKNDRGVFADHGKADIKAFDDDDDDDDDDAALLGIGEELGERVDFPVEELTEGELQEFMNLEDQIFLAESDEFVAKKLLKEKRGLYTGPGGVVRRKRIAPVVGRVAFAVGRALFRQFTRTRTTTSGSRVTQHYGRTGNYRDAVSDFTRLRPDNVRTFNGRISGQTGTMGPHRVTVRDGSSGLSRPTLEIRSHGGDVVRKFRYNP